MNAPSRDEYTATETLYADGRSALYRVRCDGEQRSVIFEVLDPHRCGERELERLRHDYETGASLGGGSIARPLRLETFHGMPAVVLEDPGGEPLERSLGHPLALDRFLDLAIAISRAVADVHAQGVVHKDLKPSNILVQPGDAAGVKLMGFGIATRLPREQGPARPPSLIEGSLPYMSPEQTGRTNRAIDSRSDLYSLGVIFHQLLTGRLPFEARDPLEWIHCHVARAPPSPAQLVPALPDAVSRIVLKLLAKLPEDRYQTARGLLHDLERCRAQRRSGGGVQPFPLGARDIPDRLQIPQRLYGREEQAGELLRAFERVADTGARELVLVSGYSGVGKSSLVHELQNPIVRRRGLFAAGKFDEHKRDVPYSTIVQAFQDLVVDVLVDAEGRVAAWRQRLEAALGMNARLVVDLVPQVELLMGPQPAVPELPPREAKRRFHAVFRRFLGVFADAEHPLTLFLDDLQWADAASLELLADVLESPETRHLLVVGAYRQNEVTPAHPLTIWLAEIRSAAPGVRELVVEPLSREHLGRLVADTLRRSPEEVAPLTALLHEKTAGNPFFAIQFLTSLHEEGLIRMDPETLAWSFDVERARERGYTSNVADLMIASLRRLPPEARDLASLAAAVGNVADAKTLALLRARSIEDTHRDAWALVREGLLHRVGDTYRFSHDRVQQAAYALIPEADRRATHLRIGRILRAQTPASQLREKVFEIVSQLDHGAGLIDDQGERYAVAELDLLAAQRARASTAYHAAAQYVALGRALLGDAAWQDRYELAFALHLEQARCEYLVGRLDAAERHVAVALRNARTRADEAECHRLRIDVAAIAGDVEKAVDALLECAARFGVAFERHPSEDDLRDRYDAVLRALGDRTIEQLVDLPPMSDRDVRTFVEALVEAAAIAFQRDVNLGGTFASEAVRLSVEHGNTPGSAHAYGQLGMVVGPSLGRYRDGYRLGKVGHELIERWGLVQQRGGTALTFGYYTLFWTRHVREAVPVLEAGLRAAVEAGELMDASYSAMCLASVLLARGDPLDEVERRSAQSLAFVRSARFSYVEDLILCERRLVHRLLGRASSPATGTGAPEDAGLDARIPDRFPQTICVYHVRRLQERFLFGEHREALSEALRAKDLLWSQSAAWERCEHSYFFALALAATGPDAASTDRVEWLRALRAEAELHRAWAESCPDNFRNRYALVSAELARVEGRELDAERLYEEAIRSARENGFVQNEALAYELAAAFHRPRGFDLFADACLREARACYVRWGADAKVRQLERLHPQLAGGQPLAAAATFAARPEELDVLSVVKASQTISGEIETERLIGTLLRAVLEQGGARRGCLVLEHDGALFVEAEASMEEEGAVTRSIPSLAMASSGLVPVSVVHRARATLRPVVVDDVSAPRHGFVSDPYFSTHPTRSVLCLPIVRQRTLVGLLYLENSHVAGAFTPDRLTTLSLLASQAAISVQNAHLLRGERDARQRAAFLAEAGAILSESLGYEETLARLARLCVGSIADWCVIDLYPEPGGKIRRLGGAHVDPAKEPILRELQRQYPPRPDSAHPSARVLRSGEALLLAEFSDADLRSYSEDEEHARLIRELGTRSIMAVPLVARGRTLGVLTLSASSPGRYARADLDLARELAHRAALAVDNAGLYREAREAIRFRDEFLSVASHELNTPVTSLMLTIQAMLKTVRADHPLDPGAMDRSLDLVVRQGRRLVRLIGDLLDVTRIEKTHVELQLVDVELGALVREVVERLEPDLARSGCSLSLHADTPVTGRWDRSRLDQVVTNLLSNAMKFGSGGPVEVSIGAEGRLARLAVTDHGIGIARAEQAHIFERFERAAPVAHYGGLGLGLYISRRIVEAHGGCVRVESEPGVGSTFTVELPIDGPPEGGGDGQARGA